MATAYSSHTISHRRSLWFPQNTSSSSSPSSSFETLDVGYEQPHRSYRYSVMSFRDKLPDFDFERVRSMSLSKTSSLMQSKPSKSSNTSSTKRPSTANTPGVLGSFRGRLIKRRPSAPLLSTLSSIQSDPLIESPTTPTGPGIPDVTTAPDGLSYDEWCPPEADDAHSGNERNLTAAPVTQIDGVGGDILIPENYLPQERRQSVDVDLSKGGYRVMSWFGHRHHTKVHPYPRGEAPYMQGYDRVLLENDRYTHLLLRRLLSNGAPTFHDYGSQPPASVLDLGCGQGSWVAEAAIAWRSAGTKVTGFDLVDVVAEEFKGIENTSWQRGNFVEYSLPFPSNSFDLIRLANLTLCVPYMRWEHVLAEVKRVLVPGGRVEVVDDHMFFPYSATDAYDIDSSERQSSESCTSWSGSDCSKSSRGSSKSLGASSESPSFLDVESDSEYGSDVQPSLYTGDSPSDTECEDLLTPTEGDVDVAAAFANAKSVEFDLPHPRAVPHASNSTRVCQDLEQVFESMLKSVYGIHTRPHDFLQLLLERVFGPEGHAKKIRSMRLSLPAPEESTSPAVEKSQSVSEKTREGKKRNLEWEVKERVNERGVFERHGDETLVQAQSEGRLNAKAAKLLGVAMAKAGRSSDESFTQPQLGDGSLSAFSQASLSRSPSTTSTKTPLNTPDETVSNSTSKPKRYQPMGLILHPDIFIPMSTNELEMHVCKHIHVLLGCKAALGEYIASIVDDRGERLMDDEDFNESIWRYECFRRARFNFPSPLKLDDDDDETALSTPLSSHFKRPFTVSSKRARSGSLSKDAASSSSSTYVRAIRIFEAYKVVDLDA